VLAAIRAHDIDVALLVHVAGAMVLVAGLSTAAGATLVGWRDDSAVLARFSFRMLLLAALPGWIVMRIGAEWVYSKEALDKLPSQPSWVGIGFGIADAGGLLLLVALILGAFGLRRSREGRASGLLRVSGLIAMLLVALYLVAVWAMSAKPT
jgi:hypothetical protein